MRCGLFACGGKIWRLVKFLCNAHTLQKAFPCMLEVWSTQAALKGCLFWRAGTYTRLTQNSAVLCCVSSFRPRRRLLR